MKENSLDVNNYKFPSHSIQAVNKFMESNVKTNIHFVLSSETLELAIRLLEGKDIFNNMIDLNKLNAIIFLLFKPQGNGKDHKNMLVTDLGIKQFRKALKESKTHFKIGLDSCAICKISEVCNDFSDEEKECIDTCEGARMSCYTTPDMKFMPCSFANHDEAGIPIKDSIKDIWNNSEIFNNFRNTLKLNPNKCPLEFAI